jgi:hypothetical protein
MRVNTDWVPLDLCFGLPLSNQQLNQEICEKIQKQKLFAPENLKKYAAVTKQLCLNLLDFIAQYQMEDWELESLGTLAYPALNLIFEKNKLLEYKNK